LPPPRNTCHEVPLLTCGGKVKVAGRNLDMQIRVDPFDIGGKTNSREKFTFLDVLLCLL